MEIIKENKKIWHPQQQIILKKWGEIGSSYRYLHDKAFMYYSKTNFRFALPVIILSTITGTANFAQKSFPESTQDYVPLFIGFLNLTAGLITTIAQFLRVSELLEGHRSASLAYSKFSRNIAIELSLPVKQRTADGTVFIKNCRMEMDRLIEQSPNIPQNILEQFGEKFKDKDFVKPEILNIGALEIYIDNEEEEEKTKLLLEKHEKQRDIIRKEIQEEIQNKENIVNKTLEMAKIEKKKRINGSYVSNSMDKLIKHLNSSADVKSKYFNESNNSSLPDNEENIEIKITEVDNIIKKTVDETIKKVEEASNEIEEKSKNIDES